MALRYFSIFIQYSFGYLLVGYSFSFMIFIGNFEVFLNLFLSCRSRVRRPN